MGKEEIIIIGAGAAGLSAALELAENGVRSILAAELPSERAQSVMAAGGINAAFSADTDSPALHAEETLRAGRYLADPAAVRGLTEHAPEIIERLFAAGMPDGSYVDGMAKMRCILRSGLGIVRNEEVLQTALHELAGLREKLSAAVTRRHPVAKTACCRTAVCWDRRC